MQVNGHPTEHVDIAQRLARPANHAAQWVLRDPNLHMRSLMQENVKAGEQAPPTGERNPIGHEVRNELGGRVVERVRDGLDD